MSRYTNDPVYNVSSRRFSHILRRVSPSFYIILFALAIEFQPPFFISRRHLRLSTILLKYCKGSLFTNNSTIHYILSCSEVLMSQDTTMFKMLNRLDFRVQVFSYSSTHLVRFYQLDFYRSGSPYFLLILQH